MHSWRLAYFAFWLTFNVHFHYKRKKQQKIVSLPFKKRIWFMRLDSSNVCETLKNLNFIYKDQIKRMVCVWMNDFVYMSIWMGEPVNSIRVEWEWKVKSCIKLLNYSLRWLRVKTTQWALFFSGRVSYVSSAKHVWIYHIRKKITKIEICKSSLCKAISFDLEHLKLLRGLSLIQLLLHFSHHFFILKVTQGTSKGWLFKIKKPGLCLKAKRTFDSKCTGFLSLYSLMLKNWQEVNIFTVEISFRSEVYTRL